MIEVWKDISGYEGIYQVSNTGRIKSLSRRVPGLNTNTEIILKPHTDKDGYLIVGLHNHGKSSNKKISRLVAQAFIPNPDNLPEVNHKDENKKNNNAENLEWCTTRYNLTYGNRLNCSRGTNNSKHKLTEKQVLEIKRTYVKGDLQFGQSALARQYNVSHQSIALIVKGKSWKHLKEESSSDTKGNAEHETDVR